MNFRIRACEYLNRVQRRRHLLPLVSLLVTSVISFIPVILSSSSVSSALGTATTTAATTTNAAAAALQKHPNRRILSQAERRFYSGKSERSGREAVVPLGLHRRSPPPSHHDGARDDEDLPSTSSDPRRSRPGETNAGAFMSATLATVYCTVMGAKCALPAALSLLANPETGGLQFAGAADPQKAFSALFFRSTLAVAAGKLLLGPIIDRMGGIRSLQIALLILASNLLFISMCHSFSTFAASWIAVDFVFSSCWAACIHAIHQCFPPNEWARQISRVAAASRLGNALAFAGFASVLQLCARERVVQPWRHLFAISGFTQLLPVAMLTAFGGGRRRSQESMGGGSDDDLSAGQAQRKARRPLWVLRREMGRVDFWLHLASRSVLMVYASFLLFVPTLMSQVYGANPATASRVGSLYAAGCLTAVTLGSDRYGKLRHQPRAKAATLAALLGASMAASTLHLGHACGWWTLGVPAASLAMLLWGLSFAIPFYIPPSLYALERGGVESSATIADAFDVAGFGLLAAFNGYVAGIRHGARAAWIPTFSATTACAAISLLSLVAVELREPPQKSKL